MTVFSKNAWYRHENWLEHVEFISIKSKKIWHFSCTQQEDICRTKILDWKPEWLTPQNICKWRLQSTLGNAAHGFCMKVSDHIHSRVTFILIVYLSILFWVNYCKAVAYPYINKVKIILIPSNELIYWGLTRSKQRAKVSLTCQKVKLEIKR